MLTVIFLVSVFLVPSFTYTCDYCICAKWQNALTCYGRNVSRIPAINATGWVSHIDLLNTSISNLRDLSLFTNLYSIDIRDNEFLDCDLVESYMRQRPDLLILTDCDDLIVDCSDGVLDEPSGAPMYDWLNVITLPPIFIIIAILITYIRKKKNSVERKIYEPCLSKQELDVAL